MSHQVHFVLPASLKTYTDGAQEIAVEADSIQAAMDALVKRFPSLQANLVNAQGSLLPHMNLFINNRQIRELDDSSISLTADSELLIVSAVAGG